MPWFYVHPARGLVEVDSLSGFTDLAPVEWHPDGEVAQDETEDRFLAALVDYFAEPETTFRADLPLPDDQARLQATARTAGVTLAAPANGVFAGPLHAGLADGFPSMTQLVLSISRRGLERLHLHDNVRQTFVQLDEADARKLRSFLERRGLLL